MVKLGVPYRTAAAFKLSAGSSQGMALELRLGSG